MATILPRYVVFKSKQYGTYLRYVHAEGGRHGFLEFLEDQVLSEYCKFEVERPATASMAEAVHIRSAYSNRYLAAWSTSNKLIVAMADKPEEDRNKSSCTLFRPILDSNSNSDKLIVRLRKYCLVDVNTVLFASKSDDSEFPYCLSAGTAPWGDADYFECVDWETLVILPRNVTFKGEGDNVPYLAVGVNGDP